MSFVSLRTSKLHEKIKKKRKWKHFPIGYVGRFYRNLAQNVDSAVGPEFSSPIAADKNIPKENVQNYLLATSNLGKEMQDDISLYVTRGRLNNARFRQKLDPIEKNIFQRQNPLEIVFKNISTLMIKIQSLDCY